MTDFNVNHSGAGWVISQLRDSTAECVDRKFSDTQSQNDVALWTSRAIWVIGLVGFGLPSVVMNPSFSTVVRFALLIIALPAAFMIFGPLWGNVLFAKTAYTDLGIYPFFATCFCVPLLSVWLGFRDRRQLAARLNSSTHTNEVMPKRKVE